MTDTLVSAILDGVAGGESWDRALDAICTVTGAKGGVIQADDAEHERTHLFGVSHFYREDGAFIIDRYLRGEDKGDEEGYRALATIPPDRMMLERAIYGMKSHNDMPESEHRTILESIGHGTRGVAVLNPSGPWYDLLTLTTGSDSAGQRVADHPAIPMILTFVAQTIELQRIMASLRQRYAAALTALDHLGLGVVLTNRNAEVVLANREGQRILDAKDGLGVNTRRQLMAGNGNANARLHAAIRDTFASASRASPAETAPATAPIPVMRPSGAYDLLVSISPMHDAAAELEPGLRTAFVLIVDPARQGALNAAGLTALGQLTRAESDVAEHLVSGKSIKEIAAVRDTSELTVRGQVKIVGAKLRCRSQTDIIRLAAITRLPMIDE